MELSDPNKYRLTEQESKRIFTERIVPILYEGISGAAEPKIIFTSGQPGAGKTVLLGHIKRQMEQEFPEQNAVVIGDDLRSYHPKYEQLLNIDDKSAAFFTDRDSAQWIEQSLEYVSQIRCNTLVESTLRNAGPTLRTAEQFKARGYKTELNIMVVPAILSRLGILQRYFEQVRNTGVGRYTIPEAHSASYNGIPDTLHAVVSSGLIDEMNFYRRGDVKIRSFRPIAELADQIRDIYVSLREEPLSRETREDGFHTVMLLKSMAGEFHEEGMIPILEGLASEFHEV